MSKMNITPYITSEDLSRLPDQASFKLNTLIDNLLTESVDREKGDIAGADALQAEKEARIARDNNLQTQIDAISRDISGLIDLFYPVGSYYETSNASFDPNTAWGGTWTLDNRGRVTVSQSTSGTFSTLGSTGGSQTNTISANNLPPHTHTYDKADSTTGQASGNTGSTVLTEAQLPKLSGSVTVTPNVVRNLDTASVFDPEADSGILYSAVRTEEVAYITSSVRQPLSHWDGLNIRFGGDQGHTHTLNNHAHTISSSSTNTGDGGFANTAMTNLQPYLVVRRWHRIA